MGTSLFETTGKYQHLEKYQPEVSSCFCKKGFESNTLRKVKCMGELHLPDSPSLSRMHFKQYEKQKQYRIIGEDSS